MPRLSTQTLELVQPDVARPAYDFQRTGIGHVHFGVGAFMRAFVATCSDDALASKGGDWGIAGVSLRQKTVSDQLEPQDCLYSLATLDNDSTAYRLIGAIRSIDVAPDHPQRIIELLAAPSVHVVTITVTEKGYGLAPDSGELDRSNPDIERDLQDLREPRSLLGFLVAGLRLRRDTVGVPLTIVSCDNLPDNGKRLRNGVLTFADEVDENLRAWIESSVSFPATMVDRITPATTVQDLDAAEQFLGLRDEALVKAEPFLQWVIENDFKAARPYWEAGGALLVDDVRPYEVAKLQLLNGPHSALAYLGYLAGHEFVSDVMQQPEFANYIRLLMSREISPATAEPAGMEHARYIDALLHRFENAALRHRTWQIAMDGSQKLPQRLLNTLRSQLKRGGPIAGLSLAVAAWMRYVLGNDEAGRPIDVQDPLLDDFVRMRSLASGDAEDVVSQFIDLKQVFGTDLAKDGRFTSTLAGQYRLLVEKGAAGAVRDYVGSSGGL
ncbi:MAG: mannitol dehydrogenase family protein [Gammaproteobacteria bacterium]|nr:mannitol dehydrogenase family protein [Gammaproteobacteria bacterium]MDH5239265.1 mannitol dehydrogenase family protein [Gammaproteobacteria bacterium]MDH5260001.1 mannitol dehydrogenase family protein [Gammaproteobacteria bacterium]MDH5620490.1 mannitol dehydrogenase family protein [Gammaproteobacteria bacterium]